jgi:hypothetical protein
MNWKVPMPDMDLTHGWITHRSMRGLGPVALEDTTRRDRFNNSYHVWFKNGHTTNINLPGEGNQMRVGGGGDGEGPREGGQGQSDIVQQYNRERAAKRRERLGPLAQIRELPHVFPNIGAVGRIIRVMHPQGPAESEMWSYILVDKKAPPEVKQQIVLGRQRISGPNGIQQKDDMENWFIQTRYSKGLMTRWALHQNNQLAMSKPVIDGPSTFGLPGNFHPHPTDENYRRFFERYRAVMEASDWAELETAKLTRVAAL